MSTVQGKSKRKIAVDANILILWSKADPEPDQEHDAERAYALLESLRGNDDVFLIAPVIAVEELLRGYDRPFAKMIADELLGARGFDCPPYDVGAARTAAWLFREARQLIGAIVAEAKAEGKDMTECDLRDDIKIVASCLQVDVDTLYSNDADLQKIAALGSLDVQRLPDYTKPLFRPQGT